MDFGRGAGRMKGREVARGAPRETELTPNLEALFSADEEGRAKTRDALSSPCTG